MWMSGSFAQLLHCIQRLALVVRTDAGLSKSFDVKVGLHQGSVLSALLFAAVMDVVSSEREVVYLPSCCMLMT